MFAILKNIATLESFFGNIEKNNLTMDMTIFQIESNKVIPQRGNILISAPFIKDFHFSRSVVLLVEHSEEGSMGIVLNKSYHYPLLLNNIIEGMDNLYPIPVFNGGPLSRDNLFYIHQLKNIEGALHLGNGLYLNGNFEQVKQYMHSGKPTWGVIRFFTGYAGWKGNQLQEEIEQNTWMVSNHTTTEFLFPQADLWKNSLTRMGGKYAIWAKYPRYPSLN